MISLQTAHTGNLLAQLGHLVVRSSRLTETAQSVEQLILSRIQQQYDHRFAHLDEASVWLQHTQQGSRAPARELRDWFKESPAVIELLSHSALHEIATLLLGAPVALHPVVRLRTVMRDFDFTRSQPHQDLALWPEEAHHINLWLALCDIDERRAPLLIARDAATTLYPHATNGYGQLAIPDQVVENIAVIPACMRYGEVVAFSPLAVHYSAPNTTDAVRFSIDMRFCRLD